MYGATTTSAGAGTTLAFAGAQTGSLVVIAVGIIVAAIAIFTLIRRGGANRP